MKLNLHRHASDRSLRTPAPSVAPALARASLAALYRAARVGGDYFDFETTGERLLLLLLDIAGRRDEALNIAAAVQEAFRTHARPLFASPGANEAEALSDLAVILNRGVMEAAAGVRCAPAFIASYDEDLGTMFYVNAGHTPALVRSGAELNLLPACGLPLGLFSHATHDAQPWVLEPGAALLLASKGLVESRSPRSLSGRQEFGMERLRQAVAAAPLSGARELCASVLGAVEAFSNNGAATNDITTVGLVRAPATAAAVAGPQV